jgi:hypothetical protein
MITLEPLATFKMTMKKGLLVPNSPAGTRVIVEFTHIEVDGPRLKAKAIGPCGDWLRVGPENTASLDFRFSLETHDGAFIFVEALGRTDATKFATGGDVLFAPVFETGDARYAWLNKVQAVAKGQAKGDVVTFEVSEVH